MSGPSKKQKVSSGDPLFDLLGPSQPCEFNYVDSAHVMAGIIPASRCSPDSPGEDATTKDITRELGAPSTWVDAIVRSPDNNFGGIGWSNIVNYLDKHHGPKERASYLERIEGAVDDGRHVVYLCGETVYKYLGVNNDNKEIQIWKTNI